MPETNKLLVSHSIDFGIRCECSQITAGQVDMVWAPSQEACNHPHRKCSTRQVDMVWAPSQEACNHPHRKCSTRQVDMVWAPSQEACNLTYPTDSMAVVIVSCWPTMTAVVSCVRSVTTLTESVPQGKWIWSGHPPRKPVTILTESAPQGKWIWSGHPPRKPVT